MAESATVRLIFALVQPALTSERVTAILDKAREGYYHDYKSPLAAPKVALLLDLEAAGLHELATRVRAGEFDEGPEEAEAWAQSPEGQATMRRLLPRKEDHGIQGS